MRVAVVDKKCKEWSEKMETLYDGLSAGRIKPDVANPMVGAAKTQLGFCALGYKVEMDKRLRRGTKPRALRAKEAT